MTTPATTPAAPPALQPPEEHPDNAEFWRAAREGRLLLRVCDDCARPHWYPRTLCPFCQGSTHWRQASGRGTVYTFSVVHRAEPAPFCLAYVTLEEGVTMLTRLVDGAPDDWRIGQPVRLRFTPTAGGAPMPTFAPAAS